MRLFKFFLHAYPGRMAAMLLCLVVATLAEGIGLSTALPLLSLAFGNEGASSPYEEHVRSLLARLGVEPSMGPLITLVIAAFWIKALLMVLSKSQVGYAVAHVATDLRLSLLRALLAARWSYYTRQPIGAISNAMATEADRASNAFHFLALILSYGIEASLYVGLAFAVSWQATLAASLGALLSVTLLSVLVRISARAGHKQTGIMKSMLGRLIDALQAVKLLKATGRESSIGPLLSNETRRLKRQLQRRVFSREALRALQEPLAVTLLCAGLYVALQLASLAPASTLMLALLVFRALSRVNSIQQKFQGMLTESSALWSMLELRGKAEAEREPPAGREIATLARALTLRDVAVNFDDKPCLEGVFLEAPARRITAILGPSGAGKTTLVDLLTGLLEPDSGQVEIDGVPLAQIDIQNWRRRIGYVPQETLLLHESIRTNISFGDPEIDAARVESALRDAGAWAFVEELPEGMESSVGERGSLLSGGQRQRIAIARALVHQPDLLILDEATAALDADTEMEVWRTIAELRGRTTVVAISHQPALASVADRIYRIESGRARRDDSTGREVA